MKQQCVAERIWYAVSPEGSGAELALRIGMPHETADMGWACEVSLGVLEAPPLTIYGADSWQALQLAMHFVARRLGYFSKQGWKFYWAKNEDAVDPDELVRIPEQGGPL